MSQYDLYNNYVVEKTKYYSELINDIVQSCNNDYSLVEKELLELINEKDKSITLHCNNVKMYSKILVDTMQVNPKFEKYTLQAAQIHDLGKIVIPDEILFNTDEFTEEEYEIMKKHTSSLSKLLQNKIFAGVLPIAIQHHERLDGNGYPYGITKILKESHIISIADAYDAMTSKRSYNIPLTKDEALEVLITKSNIQRKRFRTYQKQIKQFDPVLVKKFVKAMKDIQ